jgi:hypothetical protein
MMKVEQSKLDACLSLADALHTRLRDNYQPDHPDRLRALRLVRLLEEAGGQNTSTLNTQHLPGVPLEILNTPASRRYARAMQEAAAACKEMEEERYGKGCDGFAEMLQQWADEAETEVYGMPEPEYR